MIGPPLVLYFRCNWQWTPPVWEVPRGPRKTLMCRLGHMPMVTSIIITSNLPLWSARYSEERPFSLLSCQQDMLLLVFQFNGEVRVEGWGGSTEVRCCPCPITPWLGTHTKRTIGRRRGKGIVLCPSLCFPRATRTSSMSTMETHQTHGGHEVTCGNPLNTRWSWGHSLNSIKHKGFMRATPTFFMATIEIQEAKFFGMNHSESGSNRVHHLAGGALLNLQITGLEIVSWLSGPTWFEWSSATSHSSGWVVSLAGWCKEDEGAGRCIYWDATLVNTAESP